MSFVSISDVHIKKPGDDSYQSFLDFLKHPRTQNAKTIYLLGDIFDLMVGPKLEWLYKFHILFYELSQLVKKGKVIHFVEGNHDFHIQKVFVYLKEVYNLPEERIFYHKKPFIVKEFGKEILFCHGDEIERGNWSYKIYRFFIKSWLISLLAKLVPYEVISWIGTRASQKSRNRNVKRYSSEAGSVEVRENFIRSSNKASRHYHANVVICGHSHTQEDYKDKRHQYLNNGYFPQTHSFISGTNTEIRLVPVKSL